MKKIVFVVEGMYTGGVESTLLNLLHKIPKDSYDITLLLMQKEGDFLRFIPSHIKIEEILNASKIINCNKRKQFLMFLFKLDIISAFSFLKNSVFYKITKNRRNYFRWYTKYLGLYEEEYDIAISYNMTDSFCTQYVIDCIKASKKIMWNHIDINLYKNNELKGLDKTFYFYDKIYSVSEYSNRVFKNTFPILEDKCDVFYNIIDTEKIRKLALENVDFDADFSGFKILTVGRITPQKGQDLIVRIAQRLKNENYNFKWYILGPITDMEFYNNLLNYIEEHNLSSFIEIMPPTLNPYVYMKKCDIYVQPSRYEGFCTTTNEAKVLCKPIIVTNCSGSIEQFVNGFTGLISTIEEEELLKNIKLLMDSEELRNRLINNLSNQRFEYNNQDIEEIFL